MKLKKMRTPDSSKEWPNGIRCSQCSRVVVPQEAVLAGHERTQGSIVYHKGCIVGLVKREWPESQYDEIRQNIIDAPERVLMGN